MKKKMFILLLCCGIVVFANAQNVKPYTQPKYKLKDSALFKRFKDKNFVDSLRNAYRNSPYFNDKSPLPGSMPKRFNYAGNNGKGFDIYQTPQDNMYILRPDSTFSSNMPNANMMSIQLKPIEMPNSQKDRKN